MTSSALLKWLESELNTALAEKASNDGDRFHFGSRTIRIFGLPHLGLDKNFGGLVPAETAVNEVFLHVVDHATPAFPLSPEYPRGPYGSVLDSGATSPSTPSAEFPGWLVCAELDHSMLLAYHRESRVAILEMSSTAAPRFIAELCRPLAHWLAIEDGNVVIHGAAIGSDSRCIVVAGAGNAGKTTLVQTCVEAGFTYFGDNVVEILPRENSASLFGIYPTLKVRTAVDAGIDMGGISPKWDTDARKNIYLMGASNEFQFSTHEASLSAVLILNERGDPTIRTLSASQGVFLTAPNTVAQFPFFGSEVLLGISTLFERVPAYSVGRMDLSRAANEITELVG